VCLIVFSFQPGSATPLIVAANRDEFYRRKAQPLDWWPGGQILAGRDLGYGSSLGRLLSRITGKAQPEYGTWLGVSRSGRFAALTNYREPGRENKNARSRGLLVSNFLADSAAPPEFARDLSASANEYNGYNLLFGDRNALWYFSNRSGRPAAALAPGLYGLSNALLDTPWHKVIKTKSRLGAIVANPNAAVAFEFMADQGPAADDEIQQTGLPPEIEKALSSPFIRLPGYGTRVTSYAMFDRKGNVQFNERTFTKGIMVRDREVTFTTEP